ncbi:MAG: NADH-quinone oxidoreductase subunit NuoF [Peptococcaceae bacterium]|nr:NADH-quinone oxidoreductase subunit NuoF [Peptococcaceae bacterium]MBT9157372.1 NADP-reducing hydrogenase subunit HndC [Bacillota bacterium]
MNFYRSHVLVCAGAGCVSSGCLNTMEALVDENAKLGLDREIKVIETGCIGTCDLGPVIVVYPEGVFYRNVTTDDAREIAREHLLKGRTIQRLLYRNPLTSQLVQTYGEMEFFNRQLRIALRNTGVINPEVIEEYIARDGYEALARVLTTMSPEEVVATVTASGLRGRGGAGFPTGKKWGFTFRAMSDQKYVVCNADEGDPGAFMDRSILEGDPHAIIEAMTIAGFAVGANQGYVYVRAEYPLAVKRLQLALDQARNYGFLGKNIFSTNFSFDILIRVGAGAFVCGEETALLASIEGKRGEPRPRPPYPAVKGLWGKPTLINNVETFANICPIILYGADWYGRIGTETSKGTKVFAVAGNINNTGLVEVPMGMTLRQVVYDVCGGIPNGKEFKAAQTGGPSGGCLTKAELDVAMDYETLIAAGSMMGSGGLIVMDEDACMVDMARFFLDFTQDESCGKCTPCRIGTKRMLEILDRMTKGEGREGDMEALYGLAENIRETSLCGLGQSAPNPVLSMIKHFRSEYEAHIREKRCPAGVCQALMSYNILANKCRGCGLCARVCPTAAIFGKPKEVYRIERKKCVKCNACLEKCPFGAVVRA